MGRSDLELLAQQVAVQQGRTGQQEGGAVGSELAPEGGEEVDELEHADVVLLHEPVVLAGRHPEQNRHHDEAQLLRVHTPTWSAIDTIAWQDNEHMKTRHMMQGMHNRRAHHSRQAEPGQLCQINQA